MESKLVLGDCIKEMKTMPDNSVDFTLTDIPYNAVSRESNGLRNLDKGKADELAFDLDTFLNEVYRVTKNSICIFCGKEQFSSIFEYFAEKKGTTRCVVWQKSNPSPMNGQYIYLSGVELAVWYKKSGAKVFNAHCKNSVFKYPNGQTKYHPTEKNHQLLEDLILDNTNENDIVLDPCMGSGSCGIVSKKLNRKFYGIEIDETYFNTAKARIEKQTKPKFQVGDKVVVVVSFINFKNGNVSCKPVVGNIVGERRDAVGTLLYKVHTQYEDQDHEKSDLEDYIKKYGKEFGIV